MAYFPQFSTSMAYFPQFSAPNVAWPMGAYLAPCAGVSPGAAFFALSCMQHVQNMPQQLHQVQPAQPCESCESSSSDVSCPNGNNQAGLRARRPSFESICGAVFAANGNCVSEGESEDEATSGPRDSRGMATDCSSDNSSAHLLESPKDASPPQLPHDSADEAELLPMGETAGAVRVCAKTLHALNWRARTSKRAQQASLRVTRLPTKAAQSPSPSFKARLTLASSPDRRSPNSQDDQPCTVPLPSSSPLTSPFAAFSGADAAQPVSAMDVADDEGCGTEEGEQEVLLGRGEGGFKSLKDLFCQWAASEDAGSDQDQELALVQ